MGPDYISVKMIKLAIPIIFPILLHIYNCSLQTGVFPGIWKMSTIRPIPKVKNPKSPKDCRPISILCALSKPLEQIACEQMTTFLSANEMLEPLQSGFRSKHSTCTAALKFTTDIKIAIDLRHITIIVFFDFSKAFPSVNHKLLINKLYSFNISKSTCEWFESYLSSRFQRVVDENGNYSDWDRLKCGFPQGASLSSLLFNLFISDLGNQLKYCNYHKYADDFKLYLSGPISSLSELLKNVQTDIDYVAKWARDNGLALNSDKTQAMVVSTSGYPSNDVLMGLPSLTVGGTPIIYKNLLKTSV